jgi:subtilisin family serine protease
MDLHHLAATTRARAWTGSRALGVFAVLAVALACVPLSGAQSRAAATPVGVSTVHSVTLVTGDVVRVVERSDGRRAVSLEPTEGGAVPDASISEAGDHLYVVPQRAARLLARGVLDLDLFDVAALIELEYDDANRSTIPVIVDYGRGAVASDESRRATIDASRKTVTAASVGAAAFAADKERAREFWRSLTTGADGSGAATGLSDGAARVDLDGRVEATLDVSVPQIHAPEAWAAGYDGAGSTVAVLDSGYDPTHPDLAGQVSEAENFTADATVTDGNGHGTHVASTIAGTGAASGGTYRGVAPGADLLVGKVLSDDGFGEDSWVLAGMEWAVARGADVVSMSLGGDVTDGTDPLSRAIDDLSAQSDTLFVVAAGNNGSSPSTVTAPGAASAALTVGAVDAADTLAWFSSRGPRLGDGALKPDVTAPGVSITAARAAGTSLGFPVDDHYTELEGTSMATPHVAGLAAILKDEYPSWDGERLKSVIGSSTVAVPGSTAFEAGTGRVDAARAIAQTIVASGPLDLGYFPFPQDDLSPKATPLTYTNLGDGAVELTFSVEAQDPALAAPAGVTLSAGTVTVPAGGQATVAVVLDPSAAGAGDTSGVIVAAVDGEARVRTAFGFSLETEHYDLTVEVDPRAGTQSATHTVALVGLDTFSYEQRELAGNGDPQSVTFRVPPGRYSVGALTFGLAEDEAREGVVSYEPAVRLTAETTVVLDAAKAKPFTYVTSRPASSDGQIMLVDWTVDGGFAGLILAGNVDRLYAMPSESSGGATFTSSLNWMLSQPAAEVFPATGDAVPLQSLAAPGQQPWDVPVPRLEGTYTVVDAGAAGNVDTSAANRAIAVVSGRCDDLTGAAQALAAAGAAALVAYADDGAECAGTLEQPAPLPAFQARPYDAARMLLSSGKPGRIVGHSATKYIYDLMGAWSDRVPAGATLDGRARRVAAFEERYDTLGETSREGHRVWDLRIGWVPDRGVAAFGLVRPVSVPGTVLHYASALAEWERWVEVRSANGAPEASLAAPSTPVVAGKTISDRWFAGPIATSMSPLLEKYGWQTYPYRTGDFMWLFTPAFVDDAGHVGGPIYLGEFEGKLYQDGELVIQTEDPIWLQTGAPPEPHDYELVYTTHRENGFSQRSTTTETSWRFRSQTTEGDHEVLSLLSVDYDLGLTKHNTAPAGPFSFGVAFRMPIEVEPAPLADVSVEISWDGGAAWTNAALRSCGATGCTAQVQNVRNGSASLRITATDAAGRSVRQTVVDAYLVR